MEPKQTRDPSIPRHVGYIMDGNRRWAKGHGLPAYEGHLAGYNTFKDILRATVDSGVEYVSVYAFSTENWQRSTDEINKIMKLTLRFLKADLGEIIDENIRLRIVGTREGLSDDVIKAIDEAEAKTAHCRRATIVGCFNYGGQREIVDAVRILMSESAMPDEVDEAAIAQHLYAPDIPPVDMIVRTGGEKRLSNFMLWRSVYSELMFVDTLWPDMTSQDVAAILKEYAQRARRFGS